MPQLETIPQLNLSTTVRTPNVNYSMPIIANPIEISAASASVDILLYGAPILIIVGTVFNALSAAVMLRKNLRDTTTCLFLTVLAFVDTAILYTGLLRQWFIVYNEFDIRKWAAVTCKLHPFLLYALNQFQAWLLVIVSMERVIAVFLPHRSKLLCTRTNAVASMVITAVVLGGLDAHFFWTKQYMHMRFSTFDAAVCTPINAGYEAFVRNVWPWIDFTVFSLLPFTLLICSNVAILLRVLYSDYLRRKNLHTHGNTVKMNSMTAILITISFSFLVTTAPISIFLIATGAQWGTVASISQLGKRTMWAVFNMLTYVNNTINFLLYCVSGSRFRRELVAMFRRTRRIAPKTTKRTQRTNVAATSRSAKDSNPGQSGVARHGV